MGFLSLPVSMQRWIQPEPMSGCWLWTGGVSEKGYGLSCGQIARGAHRAVWILLRGAVPENLTLDHLCRTPPCVNPDHLEPVTLQVNIARAYAARPPQPLCPLGHNNWRTGTKRGKPSRACRACDRARREAKRTLAALCVGVSSQSGVRCARATHHASGLCAYHRSASKAQKERG